MTRPEPDQWDEPAQELVRENQRLREEIERLRKRVEELEEELRATQRKAAPYSNGKRVANPKRPGRKAGQGEFCNRPAPSPEAVSETVEVPAPSACPCGGVLEWEGEEWATTTDLPLPPQPRVTGYRVAVCRCRKCGRRVTGSAPGLAPDQWGATAHRVGPGVKAAAHALHYQAGVTARKLPLVLKELTGVEITQGALTQDALRRTEAEVGEAYQQLRDGVHKAPVVNTDDTSWGVGGKVAHLMAFVTAESTVYQIRPQHRNEEVRELIPSDYRGVMGTDRGKSYDAREFVQVDQQKCLGHIQRNIKAVVEDKQGRAREFGLTLKGLLVEAQQVWKKRPTLCAADYQPQVDRIEAAVTHHLRDRVLKDDDNQRLLNGIGWHHDRGNLLRFLHVEGVEPTNNRAERALRPAVIGRKVSQCSKTPRGAEAYAAFASVLQTAAQRGVSSTIRYLRELFQPSTPPAS